MIVRHRHRIYPTPGQIIALEKAFGCSRVVYNDGLRIRQEAFTEGRPFPRDSELSRQLITEAKRTPERAWLGEVSAAMLQQALRDLSEAYRNYFASKSGRRAGRKMNLPKFRTKKSRQAVRYTNQAFRLGADQRLRLHRVQGWVKVHWSRPLPSKPTSVTIIKDSASRYFASFVVQVHPAVLPIRSDEVGIDLGLTHFAVMSDGTKVGNPRHFVRATRLLRRHQRALVRKQKRSSNWEKAKIRLARRYARVTDLRKDFQNKLSTAIVRDNQAIYAEDLHVSGLKQARGRMAKLIQDASWSAFLDMLEYKSELAGRTFVRIDRFFPSSKMCSECGRLNESMPLAVRTWTCPCGAVHDRDFNAAKNILAQGRWERLNACGGGVRPGLALATANEAGTHRSVAMSTQEKIPPSGRTSTRQSDEGGGPNANPRWALARTS